MAIIVPAVAGKIIHIGRAGENLATTVTFDVSEWIKPEPEGGFGNRGSFTLFVQQGGGEYYPQLLKEAQASLLENGLVEWRVSIANTITVGMGKCELVYALPTEIQKEPVSGYYYESAFYSDVQYQEKIEPNTLFLYIDLVTGKYYYYNGINYIETEPGGAGTTQSQIVKSIIYDIVVTNSLDIEAAGDVPTPIESWLNTVSEMTAEIEEAADHAEAAENSKNESEQWAKGTINGEAVASDHAGYHDNSKYYSEQAEQWATGGSGGTPTSQNNSKYYSNQAQAWAEGKIGTTNIPSTNPAYNKHSKYYADRAAQWVTGGTTGSPSSTNNAKYYSDLIGHMTVNVETLKPGEPATVEVEIITQDNNSQTIEPRWNLDFSIPKGDGLKIDGQVNQSSSLPSTAAIGSVYAVGSAPVTYYFKTENDWIELGIQGGTTIQKYIYTTNS